MSFEIVVSRYFATDLKRLTKRYKGLSADYKAFVDSLKANPFQGVEIAPKIRKIRMAVTAKGRGKSGGARVITYNALVTEQEGTVYLLLIYDKADTSNVKINVIKQMVKEMGLE